MKTRVVWRADNPFVSEDKRDLVRQADVPADTLADDEQVEHWAQEATPEGYHLHQIDCPLWVIYFDENGNRKIEKS